MPQVCIEGRPIVSKVSVKSAFWSVDGEAVSVEQLALLHYASPEAGAWQGARPLRLANPKLRTTRTHACAAPHAAAPGPSASEHPLGGPGRFMLLLSCALPTALLTLA